MAASQNPRCISALRDFFRHVKMSSIGAVTLVDVVAYPDELDHKISFPELVHVVQYRVLGLKRFARLYVIGFLKGGSYEQIPLERQAYNWKHASREIRSRCFRWRKM